MTGIEIDQQFAWLGAIFSLLGAVLGAVISGVIGWLARKRQEKITFGLLSRYEAQSVLDSWAELIAYADCARRPGTRAVEIDCSALFLCAAKVCVKVDEDTKRQINSVRDAVASAGKVPEPELLSLKQKLEDFALSYSIIAKNAVKHRNKVNSRRSVK